MKSQRTWDTIAFATIGGANILAGIEPGWVLVPDGLSVALGFLCLVLAALRWFGGPR